jgi:hypothetical protein
VLADKKVGDEILEYLRELSQAFGTKVEIEDNVGVVRL